MKIGSITTVIIFLIIFFSGVKVSFSQNCEKRFYCEDNFDDKYTFTSQSRYGTMPLGDKKRIKTSCYSNKRYRIFACGDPELNGDVHFKIIKEVRKNVRKIQQIRRDTIISYQLDQWGEIAYPEENNYKPVELSRTIETDTIWETTRVVEEKVLYDSRATTDGKTYWEASITQGYSIIIEVETPPGDPDIEDCVNIYVGSKSLSSKQFGGTGKNNMGGVSR